MKATVLAEPALVGREQELEELQRHLTLALEGKGNTILVSGEAGSGKTRLTREFLNTAREKRVAVLAGWCLGDAATPYFPFVEAFNSYFARLEEDQPASLPKPGEPLGFAGMAQAGSVDRGITAWLAGPRPIERTGKPEELSPQVWKDQVFAGVARTLHEISVHEPIILFIEDIHWADSASLALLHYVARAVNNSERIMVLATFRSEELTADAEGHPHPLAEAMRLMRREDLFSEISLSSINQSNVSKIAENMLGGSLQLKLAEKLMAESRGNPLFVVESLRMLYERKSLFQEGNWWCLEVDELGIPTKIKDIILRRLAILKYAQRRVLDAASVIGEKFDVELLSTVLGLDTLDVLETLNVIAHSTSLVSVEENCYRFDHSTSRETLLEELSAPLKRGYHAKIAEKLENTRSERLPLSELAYHYAQAGNKEKSIKYALAAGQDEYARFSHQQAISHFTYVLKTIGDEPIHAQERAAALEGLAEAYYSSNIFLKAVETFEQLSSVATGVVKLRALRRATNAAIHLGNYNLAAELVVKGEKYVSLDRLEAARLYILKGVAYGSKGEWKGEWSAKAFDIIREEYSLPDAAWAFFATGYPCVMRGEIEEGLARGLFSVALYEELSDPRQLMLSCDYVGQTFFLSGLFPEGQRIFEKALKIEDKMKLGDLFNLAHIYVWLSIGLNCQKDFRQALTKSLKAVEYAERSDSGSSRASAYAHTIADYARLEDPESAEKYVDKLMKLPQTFLSRESFAVLALAAYYVAKGDWQKGIKYAEEYSEVSKSLPSALVDAGRKNWQSRFLTKQGRMKEATEAMAAAEKIFEDAQKRFEHVNIQTSLMAPARVTVGQTFGLRLDLVNVSRSQGSLVSILNILPHQMQVVASHPEYIIQDDSIQLKESSLEPFAVKTIKLTLQATKTSTFSLSPQIVYVDDLGQTQTVAPRPITVTVKPAQSAFETLPGRVTTGYSELDRLLMGGIPKNYAVILSSPSVDERELLVKKFLEAGPNAGEITFHVTAYAGSAKAFAEECPSKFFLLVCNPQADAVVQDLPNVVKLKGVENLTDIDIALTKAFRTLNPTEKGTKRICIEIVSDVLLQQHTINTRRWLGALLPTLKSKGFTILAVVDPQMHPAEELQAVLGLFDGEISIREKETPKGTASYLKVKKMTGQKYLKDETLLTEE